MSGPDPIRTTAVSAAVGVVVVVGITAYCAKRAFPTATNPLLHNDWKHKINARLLFENGLPDGAKPWKGEWGSFTDWFVKSPESIPFQVRYGNVPQNVMIWNPNAGQFHQYYAGSVDKIESTLGSLRNVTSAQLLKKGKRSLKIATVANYSAIGVFGGLGAGVVFGTGGLLVAAASK